MPCTASCAGDQGVLHLAHQVPHVRVVALARHLRASAQVARRLGDAEVDGHDQRHGHGDDGVEEGVPLAPWGGAGRRRPRARRRSRSSTSCEPVARMAMCARCPARSPPRPSRGTGKCSTVGPSVGSSKSALVTSRSPAGEPLPKILRAVTRKPPRPASLDALGPSGGIEPVRGPGADQDELLGGDALAAGAPPAAPGAGARRWRRAGGCAWRGPGRSSRRRGPARAAWRTARGATPRRRPARPGTPAEKTRRAFSSA